MNRFQLFFVSMWNSACLRVFSNFLLCSHATKLTFGFYHGAPCFFKYIMLCGKSSDLNFNIGFLWLDRVVNIASINMGQLTRTGNVLFSVRKQLLINSWHSTVHILLWTFQYIVVVIYCLLTINSEKSFLSVSDTVGQYNYYY